jgi:hypothetical protein
MQTNGNTSAQLRFTGKPSASPDAHETAGVRRPPHKAAGRSRALGQSAATAATTAADWTFQSAVARACHSRPYVLSPPTSRDVLRHLAAAPAYVVACGHTSATVDHARQNGLLATALGHCQPHA